MPNVKTYAEALFALHQAKLLKNEQCKKPVKLFIRLATEPSKYPHLTCHYRSKAAAKQIEEAVAQGYPKTAPQYHSFCSKKENRLSHEHVVPVEVIYKMIQVKDQITRDWLIHILGTFSLRATITQEENGKLRTSEMPEGFYDPNNSDLYEKPLARYIEVGIDKDLEKRVGGTWFPAQD